MATKVKICIDTEAHKIHLPALPFSMISFIAKIALRFSTTDTTEMQTRQLLLFTSEFLKHAKQELKHMEPFVLAEVQDEDNYILIEMR